MGKLEKVIVENGITYVLGEDDIYYSDLQLPEGTNYNIGKFGHMRCEYLKEFKHGYYMKLLLDGRLKNICMILMRNAMRCWTGLWKR